jgi:diguanylate cyclase (GGDEF)-like protein
MSGLQLSPMLWLVGFQLGLYAFAWVLVSLLLGEERPAVMHWGGFLLLTAVTLLLAGARTEPRSWLVYNGANIASLFAFASMRRGVERFMRLPSSDREQALLLGAACALFGGLGPDADQASWRVVFAYGGQGFIMLRTFQRAWAPMRAEFGHRTLIAIAVPGLLIGTMLLFLSLRQLFDWGSPYEMQRGTADNLALMYYYLGGAALFNFGFMVLLTQRLVLGLRRASRRDELTGIANRRAMDEALDRAWQRFHRHGRGFAVVLVDIDHFKRINDTLGHAAGDSVLVQVAQRLQQHARASDAVGRIGGEEFLLLLDETAAAPALQSAERLRALIGETPVPAAGQGLTVTVSVGVAVIDAQDREPDLLLRRADRALYRAKGEGRNRVAFDGAA